MASEIQMHKLPPEALLWTGAAYNNYSDPVPESAIYGGFADVDGDGRKDLVIVVDNDLTCDDNGCDFFVFAPVVMDRQVVTACDWHLVEERREPITPEAGKRLVVVGGQSVVLTRLPQEMPCTLNGNDWHFYFHLVYQHAHDTDWQKLLCAALTGIRPGFFSADEDTAG
jgi:hypothetical protein